MLADQQRVNSCEQLLLLEKSIFRESRVLTSKPEKYVSGAAGQGHFWWASVSQDCSTKNDHFRPLSIDENETHRKWRRAALAFYGLIAMLVIVVLIGIGPPRQTAVKDNPAYSAIASRGHNKPD
jgi:hypothetical protein